MSCLSVRNVADNGLDVLGEMTNLYLARTSSMKIVIQEKEAINYLSVDDGLKCRKHFVTHMVIH